MSKNANELTIVIATYNECNNIQKLIPVLIESRSKPNIIIVDDNSPDHTAEKIHYYIEKYPNRIELIERPSKLGYASAFVEGFKRALELNSNFIISMDADLSHDPCDIGLQ